LGAEPKADFLRSRCRGANHGRGRVEHSSQRIEIGRGVIVGERLDNHPGAVGLQSRKNVRGGADRIAHVMQTVKASDEIIGSGKILRGCFFETDAIGEARRMSAFIGFIDRRLMEIETGNLGFLFSLAKAIACSSLMKYRWAVTS
jgi:hypothetical protein